MRSWKARLTSQSRICACRPLATGHSRTVLPQPWNARKAPLSGFLAHGACAGVCCAGRLFPPGLL